MQDQWLFAIQKLEQNSAPFFEIFKGEELELFQALFGPDRSQSPRLFTVFLDPSKSVKASGSVSFAFDLKVLVPDYEVDGVLFLKRHYEGGYVFRQLVLVEAFSDAKALGGWRINWDRLPGPWT